MITVQAKSFTRSSIFWILFGLLSFAGIVFSFKYFSKAFPIVDLELTMDRQEALKKADMLAQQFNWGPEHYSQAASFNVESEVQYFIELEAGGKQEFAQILKEKYYSPYTWMVRHFKEYDATEMQIFFTPQGVPYGFIQKIPESAEGAALSVDQARALAQEKAQKDWHINFDMYKAVEESQEVTSTGRIDHTFVYERIDKKVGQAPYRLKLIVRGDHLTELKLSVKVPETFKRKYQEMRSSNNMIALTSNIIMILLYVFCGCFLGLFFLLRSRWLIVRSALIWAFIVGIFQAANFVNQIPLLWLGYDTAISQQKFMGQIIFNIIIQFFMYTGAYTFLFMIAESLTRKAFPNQIQFWKLWSKTAGSSIQVLGRTLAGYLILGLDFAYSIGLYYVMLKFFGWWSPSEALYDPNTLATYFPWVSPIASSLSAGFMEECLFRAIPLASAALLGNRFGKRKLWIGCAFIVQALIFGAAHANYPAQPAYARLVELIFPSVVFGLLYLWYGLLPAILSHFVFDVVWFSLPIFISAAPGIWIDKVIIILICLIPLFVVLYRRLQSGKWLELPSSYYNYAWQAPKFVMSEKSLKESDYTVVSLAKKYSRLIVLSGLLGLVSWIVFTRFVHDVLPLNISQSEAIAHAQEMTKTQSAPWTSLAGIDIPLQSEARNQHMYIWKTLGESNYKKLLSTYLLSPTWKIRLVRFDGDLADRAEEFQVYLGSDPTKQDKVRIHHQLPEDRPMSSLSLEKAREQALMTLQMLYGLTPQVLKEISAVPRQQPNRVDWIFTFQDTSQELDQGQARLTVEIDGEDVVDTYRSIFVPQQWERTYKDEQSLVLFISRIIGFILIFLMLLAFVIVTSYAWSQATFSIKMFLLIMISLLLKTCIQAINIWPLATFTFNTIEPFGYQAWRVINMWLLGALFKSVSFGLIAGFLQGARFKSPQMDSKFTRFIWFGVAFGLVYGGVTSFFTWLTPLTNPQWADFGSAGAYLPWLSIGLTAWTEFVENTLIALLIFTAVDYVTDGWEKNKWFAILFFIAYSMNSIAVTSMTYIWIWLVGVIFIGIVISMLYIYGIRFSRASIPMIVATFASLELVQKMIFKAYPDVFFGGILGIILMSCYALYWCYQLAYNKNGIQIHH